jgi:hypothetical protein
MVSIFFRLLLLIASLSLFTVNSQADLKDPFDTFDQTESIDKDEEIEQDKVKSADELIAEANVLLQDERPLDARTKLLRALQRDPKAYRAHILLASYYMTQVGHFRLALKYVKQAQKLFSEEQGNPPFYSYEPRTVHGYLLYLLSQARLNLDDYAGALEVLDEFKSYGYDEDWYAGTRSWILMKLGRLDEAIKVAREGLQQGSELGRTLNMLGILLSMKGDRQGSLDIFQEATKLEFSLGKSGSPATPLNNAGEVYKEIFLESKAQGSWLKAVSLPDGCEHVLPALNLSLLLIDQINLSGAKRAIDNFESCVAQFPLRNGEEHRALVRLARGRIALHSGFAAEATKHFEEALQKQQWFGKIGTSEDDLKVALLISLSQSLQAENNYTEMRLKDGPVDIAKSKFQQTSNRIRAWWSLRRAKQILIDDLSFMEDLFIRNTDSMIEYPTFGEALKDIPSQILEEKIKKEIALDARPQAMLYYSQYRAENELANGEISKGLELLNKVLSEARPEGDALLRARALVTKLSLLDRNSVEYTALAGAAFKIFPALLRNYGLALPVNVTSQDPSLISLLADSPFLAISSKDLGINLIYEANSNPPTLSFLSDTGAGHKSLKVSGTNLKELINKLADSVFTEKL